MSKSETRQFIYNDRVIIYELSRKSVKNLNLRIKSDGTVSLSANRRVSIAKIDEFILSKADFIIKHIDRFAAMRPPVQTQRAYDSGEIFFMLGEKLQLSVMQSTAESVQIVDKQLCLYINGTENYKRKEKLIEDFFNSICNEVFLEIARDTYELFKEYSLEFPLIKIRTMTSRWGSCAPHKNRITLNRKLIEKPRCCVEYVILHEFAHFIHPDHSKRFYDFVATLMPDWKSRKKLLEQSIM